jgi:CRISPR/Cas system-associated protein endoribonuclease Cas2
MKYLGILLIVMLPVVTLAQRKTKTVEYVMKTYTDDYHFNYFEISNDLLKELVNTNDLDQKSKEKLLKIETIRVLELDTGYYRRIRPKPSVSRVVIKENKKGITIKEADTANLNILPKKNNFPSLYNTQLNWFYDDFIGSVDIKPFTVLLSTKKKGKHLIFLKRSLTDNKTEYVLITDINAIQIIGDVDLRTVTEIQHIIDELASLTF